MSFIDKILRLFGKKKPVEKPTQVKKPAPAIKNKHLYTSKMINSITLSSDMKTLYLIDNGRAIDFPIDDKVGILIGKIGNQISVATAVNPIETDEGVGDNRGASSRADGRRVIKLSAAAKSQWTMTFHEGTHQLGIIGTTDIDLSLTHPQDVECDTHFINLTNKIINIRRIADELELIVMDK